MIAGIAAGRSTPKKAVHFPRVLALDFRCDIQLDAAAPGGQFERLRELWGQIFLGCCSSALIFFRLETGTPFNDRMLIAVASCDRGKNIMR